MQSLRKQAGNRRKPSVARNRDPFRREGLFEKKEKWCAEKIRTVLYGNKSYRK